LHIGLIRYLQEDFQGAYQATSKAIELSPNLCEAYYEHARYCSKLGKYDEAVKYLESAIFLGDAYYCIKVYSEKDFDTMRDRLRLLFEEWLNQSLDLAKSVIDKLRGLIQDAESEGLSYETSHELASAKNELNKVKILYRRESLLDCWDATCNALKTAKAVADSLVKHLSNQNFRIEQEHNNKVRKHEEMLKNVPTHPLTKILLVLMLPLFFVVAYYSRNWLLGFGSWFAVLVTAGLGIFAPIVVAGLIQTAHRSNLKKDFERYRESYENELSILLNRLSQFRTKREQLRMQEEEIRRMIPSSYLEESNTGR